MGEAELGDFPAHRGVSSGRQWYPLPMFVFKRLRLAGWLLASLLSACGDGGPGIYRGEICLFGYDSSADGCSALIDEFYAAPGIERGVVAYSAGGSDLELPCSNSGCTVFSFEVVHFSPEEIPSDAQEFETELQRALDNGTVWLSVESGSSAVVEPSPGQTVVCARADQQSDSSLRVWCVGFWRPEAEIRWVAFTQYAPGSGISLRNREREEVSSNQAFFALDARMDSPSDAGR